MKTLTRLTRTGRRSEVSEFTIRSLAARPAPMLNGNIEESLTTRGDIGFIPLWKANEQTILPIFELLSTIWKNVYAIVVARRRVFTQPRPKAVLPVLKTAIDKLSGRQGTLRGTQIWEFESGSVFAMALIFAVGSNNVGLAILFGVVFGPGFALTASAKDQISTLGR